MKKYIKIEDIEWDKLESKFRKYRRSLDGIETIQSYTFFLKNNDESPFKI